MAIQEWHKQEFKHTVISEKCLSWYGSHVLLFIYLFIIKRQRSCLFSCMSYFNDCLNINTRKIYAWSVVKSAYPESNLLDLKKKPSFWLKEFSCEGGFSPGAVLFSKRCKRDRGFWGSSLFPRKVRAQMTAHSPLFYEMKLTKLASSYCPTSGFENHQGWRCWWSLLVKSRWLQRNKAWWIDPVAIAAQRATIASGSTYTVYLQPLMSSTNWTFMSLR